MTDQTTPLALDERALLPCPFCGGKPEQLNPNDAHGGMVNCQTCGAAAFGPKWNRRALSSQAHVAVAWRWRFVENKPSSLAWTLAHDMDWLLPESADAVESQPLYAHPAPSEGVNAELLAALLDEGNEILTGIIDNIRRRGNYSPESTCVFIDQAGQCFREARASLAAPPREGDYRLVRFVKKERPPLVFEDDFQDDSETAAASPSPHGRETVALDQPLGEFKPCVVVNQEAGITEAIFEDAAYVAKPVFDGVYHWMDELRAVDDGRLVGFQAWLTKPVASPHGREGCPHCRGEDHKCPYGDCPDERCPYRAPHGTGEGR